VIGADGRQTDPSLLPFSPTCAIIRPGLSEAPLHIEIAGERLPVHRESLSRFDRDVAIPLPNHRALYADPDLAAVVERVLEEEGLTLYDLDNEAHPVTICAE